MFVKHFLVLTEFHRSSSNVITIQTDSILRAIHHSWGLSSLVLTSLTMKSDDRGLNALDVSSFRVTGASYGCQTARNLGWGFFVNYFQPRSTKMFLGSWTEIVKMILKNVKVIKIHHELMSAKGLFTIKEY